MLVLTMMIVKDSVAFANAEEWKMISYDAKTGAQVSRGDVNLPTVVQQIGCICEAGDTIGESYVGNTSSKFWICPVKINESEKQNTAPIVGVFYEYDGEEHYFECTQEGVAINIPYEYSGSLYCYGIDAWGRSSNEITMQVMVDSEGPDIEWSEETVPEGTVIHVTAREMGDVVSGIDEVECYFEGELFNYSNYCENEIVENNLGQAVIKEVSFDIPMESVQDVKIELKATDYAGNETLDAVIWSANAASEEREVVAATETQLLKVSIPTEFRFTVEPWNAERQIYSEPLAIVNNSDCDIYFKLHNVNIGIDRDNVTENSEVKSCSIYLETDDGQRFDLQEGDSGELCVVRIPGKNSGNDENSFAFTIGGSVNPDSAIYWENGDIQMDISVRFWGIKTEEEAQIVE